MVVFSLIPFSVRRSQSLAYYLVSVFWAFVSNPQSDTMYFYTAWSIIIYTKLVRRSGRLAALLILAAIAVYAVAYGNITTTPTTVRGG